LSAKESHMYTELNGNIASKHLKEEIQKEVELLVSTGKRPPHLAAIIVGNDGASHTYVNMKEKACAKVGYSSTILRFDDDLSEEDLLNEIEKINTNPEIDGLLVQLPLPKHINESKITESISPLKDVDGFHTISIGKLAKGEPGFVPATPLGIIKLFEYYNISPKGKDCVVLGRSNIVGRPMSILLSLNDDMGNATVTLCHSRTQNLADHCRRADILIVALGVPEFVKGDMVKKGATVIDVGISRVDDENSERGYVLKGDVEFESVTKVAGAVTPVPRGVGPMTILGLLQNTLNAYKFNN
jgi:methylenetetrahydrofolate dehydrogenase (NADP+)/methenyltetrahydrofolate cyclohydrolase